MNDGTGTNETETDGTKQIMECEQMTGNGTDNGQELEEQISILFLLGIS